MNKNCNVIPLLFVYTCKHLSINYPFVLLVVFRLNQIQPEMLLIKCTVFVIKYSYKFAFKRARRTLT